VDVNLLACNVGSSSIRVAAFACANGGLEQTYAFRGDPAETAAALEAARAYGPFEAIAHRIVHGGRYAQCESADVDGAVRAEIARVQHLAPDHNPAALETLAKSESAFPGVRQVAVFDSAFHAGMPEMTAAYPIARDVAAHYGIRRLGFHGLSHRYSAQWVLRTNAAGKRPLRHVSVHVGNGVSAAAILDGRSIDTTMGFTPMEGAMMGTRSGSVDPGIVFELQRAGMPPESVRALLDGNSGLLGVSGVSGDYAVVAQGAAESDACRLALEMYHYRLAGEIARMAAVLAGLDVLSFTGGVGEHHPQLRETICSRLFLRVPSVFTIAAREEEMMAAVVSERVHAET